MTTSASGRKFTSACDGVSTSFANPKLATAGDLKVYLLDAATDANSDGTLLAEGADYTIAVDLSSITTTVAQPLGKYIRRWRETSRAQQVEFNTGQAVPAASQEGALDRLSLIDEEHDDDVSHALKVPQGETAPTLPRAIDRIGMFLVGTADGGFATSPGTGADADALFTQLGTGAVARSVLAKLYDIKVSPMDYLAIGDGVTDDSAAILAALASGKIVDLGGRTYAVAGQLAPMALKGMVNGTLKQLAPTTANLKTLTIIGNTGFLLRDVTIDRGGAAGYTVGDLDNYAGLWIENCSEFLLDTVLATNGGRGTGTVIRNCSSFETRGCATTEHYWQEVNPAVPVIVDDIVQAFWIDGCSSFSVAGCHARNVTSGAPGNQATGVAAAQVRRYTRWAFGGNSRFVVSGCWAENIDQAFDFTGTVGNDGFTVTACVARDAGTNGFKFADSAYNVAVSACIATDCGQTSFLTSGRTEAANPDSKHIIFTNCISINSGSNKLFGAIAGRGFANESELFDAATPRGIAYIGCRVIDNQGLTLTAAPGAGATAATLASAFTGTTGSYAAAFDTNETKTVTLTNGSTAVTWTGGLAAATGAAFLFLPTTLYGFRNNVAAIEPPAAEAVRPYTVTARDCSVDVPGILSDNRFNGLHHPYVTAAGTAGHTDACADSTWTTLLLDGTEFEDPSALHSPTTNPDRFVIKESGLYAIKAKTAFATSSAGTRRGVRILVNGGSSEDSTFVGQHATQKTYINDTFMRFLFSGDYVQMQGFQDSGGSLNVDRGDSVLALVKVF